MRAQENNEIYMYLRSPKIIQFKIKIYNENISVYKSCAGHYFKN
jgi:hypothetical protein